MTETLAVPTDEQATETPAAPLRPAYCHACAKPTDQLVPADQLRVPQYCIGCYGLPFPYSYDGREADGTPRLSLIEGRLNVPGGMNSQYGGTGRIQQMLAAAFGDAPHTLRNEARLQAVENEDNTHGLVCPYCEGTEIMIEWQARTDLTIETTNFDRNEFGDIRLSPYPDEPRWEVDDDPEVRCYGCGHFWDGYEFVY